MAKPYSFDLQGLDEEARQIRSGLRQVGDIIDILCTAAGIVSMGDSSGWFNLQNCNGLLLLPRVFPGNQDPKAQAPLISSLVAEVFVQFNREDYPWLPFSLILNNLDFAAFTGTIYRCRFYVNITDAAPGHLYFVPLTACGIASTARSAGVGINAAYTAGTAMSRSGSGS